MAALVALLAGILLVEAAQRGEIEIRSLDTPRWVLFAPLSVGFTLIAVEFVRLIVLGESLVKPVLESRENL